MRSEQIQGWKIIDSAFRIMTHYEEMLRPYKITLWEYRILTELEDECQLRSSVIAERIGLTRGAVSRNIQSLIERNMIFRTDDKLDRRAFWVGITPTGKALLNELRKNMDKKSDA